MVCVCVCVSRFLCGASKYDNIPYKTFGFMIDSYNSRTHLVHWKKIILKLKLFKLYISLLF